MSVDVSALDARDVFRRSRKFDLIYKLHLAKVWAGGDGEAIRRAEVDYLEMQRARFAFFENTPRRTRPEDFVSAFRRVADSIRADGFSPEAPPVHLEAGTLELIDGHHRLACCLAYGKPCRFAYGEPKKRERLIATFRTFRESAIAPSVENRGVRAYLDDNERARIIETPAQPGEDEEAAIARVERDTHGLVWHASRHGNVFVFVLSFPEGVPDCAGSREMSLARAAELFPELPDPDWRARAHAAPRWRWRFKRLKYALTLPFRFGRKREKAKWHLAELACQACAYERLADYVEEHHRVRT